MKIQTLKKIVLIVIIFLSFTGIQAQNAPITTAGSGSVCPNVTISVPITVTGFAQITALSLRLDFNPTLVDYTSYSNLNSSLSGCFINSVLVSSTLEKILIIWSDITPLTLTNGSKLVDLNFTLLSGSPTISFNNTANGGGDCEYADAIGDPLNDYPTSTYYIHATVTNMGPGTSGLITGTATVCQGQNGVAYSVPVITNATGYTWSLPLGATIASGSNTNSILVNYDPTATSGIINVQGTNSCGPGQASPDFEVNVNTSRIWTGAISTAWENAGNWCGSIVPTSTSDVIIDNAINNPVISSSVTINSLTIVAGATFSAGSGALVIILSGTQGTP